MGERKKDVLRVNFDRKLKLEFHGVKVTSDAANFQKKLSRNRKFLIVQDHFGKFIDGVRRNFVF
jgi:hypothetical protein